MRRSERERGRTIATCGDGEGQLVRVKRVRPNREGGRRDGARVGEVRSRYSDCGRAVT